MCIRDRDQERPFSNFTSALRSQDSSIGLRVTISFVGIYLGITFLVTAAVILALQQLSAANDNKKRYAKMCIRDSFYTISPGIRGSRSRGRS